jgi:DNA helicase-2/ATP-dependent DNA helicase PcrA
MAVLYRSHFHALELQLELTRRNIPFSITSGIRFFEQAHIKDVTAYLKLVTNPRDELAFKRLALLLPGIGGKGAEKLWQILIAACEKPPDLRTTLLHPNREGTGVKPRNPVLRRKSLAAALQSCAKSVPKKATLAWAQFATTISQLEAPDIRISAAKMIPLVIEAGYDDYLKENFANYRSRLDDLKQLAIFAQQFESVEEFLTQMALLTNVEAEDEQQPEPRRREDPPLHHPSGQGPGVRRGVQHHALRRVVSLRAIFGNGRRAWKKNAGCFTSPSRAPRTNSTSVTR